MQMKRADTVCYNIVRLRCKRRCNTETCIKSLRRKRQYNTDRDYAMCSKSLRQYKTDKHIQITSRKHMSIMSATQATVRHRNVYRKAATQTMVRHRQTHTDTSCTCNECLCVCMCTWDKDENEEREQTRGTRNADTTNTTCETESRDVNRNTYCMEWNAEREGNLQ